MIKYISRFEYLGNGLNKFNSNMKEFNIRIDNLYNSLDKWKKFKEFSDFSEKFQNLRTTMQTYSANWKNSSDLVYNLQGYWEEPIQIAFDRTFNYVANFVEVETWLNENFTASVFSPSQILRCDYLCKNYSGEMLEGYRLSNYNSKKTEEIAALYKTTSKKIYRFLGLKNQLNAIISLINLLLRKYNNTTYVVDTIRDLTTYSTLVTFNKSQNIFSSVELDNFSNTDLAYFDSYVTQYNSLYKIYTLKYIELEVIPVESLIYFDLRDVAITSGGALFFKNINNSWKYHPYTNIEFCPRNTCSDCYDNLDLNSIYENREYCDSSPKYILTECGESLPYSGSLSFSSATIITNEELEQLSDLLS